MKAITETERARHWYNAIRPVAKLSLHSAWLAGYNSWERGKPCQNPYNEQLSTDLWSAYQMGWQQAKDEDGGR